MEIRDIKIINQCLKVQGVWWLAFFLSVCLPLSMFISRSNSSFFFLSHTLSFVLSLEAVEVPSPEVSPVKVVLNAATHKCAPQGKAQPLYWQ